MPKIWVDGQHTDADGKTYPTRSQIILCSPCLDQEIEREGEERYSLGLFAGYYCKKCWESSGYRKEDRDGFDPADAGEAYEAE